MEPLNFVTGNKNKAREAQTILQIPINIVDLELDEVQSMDLEYVARKKAEEAFKIVGKPIMVDDVGVFIDAWNSFPGPFAKYVYEYIGNQKLLTLLKGEENRAVSVVAIIAYYDGENMHLFKGEMKGTISTEERGGQGWGYDPIVIPEGEEKTLAELGIEHKNHHSHRALALKKFRKFLESK